MTQYLFRCAINHTTTMTTRTIKSTTDYTKFSLMESNRKVYKPHVKRLIAFFEFFPRSAEWLPILVNEKMQIADGQHRFHALQELGLPVSYIEVDGLSIDDARRLNAGAKPWTPMDYALCFCGLGSNPYCFYVELKKKYRFNHDILMRFVALDDPITGEAFRQGRLTAPDKKRTTTLCDALSILQKITNNPHRSLAFAFKELYDEGADVSKVLKEIENHYKQGKRIEPFKDVEDYLRSLRKFV